MEIDKIKCCVCLLLYLNLQSIEKGHWVKYKLSGWKRMKFLPLSVWSIKWKVIYFPNVCTGTSPKHPADKPHQNGLTISLQANGKAEPYPGFLGALWQSWPEWSWSSSEECISLGTGRLIPSTAVQANKCFWGPMDKKSLSIQTVWQDEHIMREKMKLGHQTEQEEKPHLLFVSDS